VTGPRRALILALALALAGCAPQHDGDPLERETVATPADSAVHPVIAGIATDPVEAFEGPGGRPFWTTRRTPEIEQYPCDECHTPGQPATGELDSHADVAADAVHPARLDASCDACHAPEDRSVLQGRDGTTYGLDEAYRLCAECHFRQAEDWAGGGHGKREGAWEGRRVVRSCTGCHDPHAPAFGLRQPVRFPRIPRTGGRH
jgi:hypothetical protein